MFTRLQERSFSPSDFELTEKSNDACLRHRSTDYFFIIEINYSGEYSASFSPGENIIKEVRPSLNWMGVEIHFTRWMDNLKEEIEALDLWAAISSDTQLIKSASDQDNRPFTPDEQIQFKKALNEIKAYLIKSHSLTGARLETIEGRLSYLEEAVTRMGRKDAIHIAIGVLANIATGLALDASSTRELFQFAGQIFKQLLGTVLYLAGPH
ncbi:MAG: hypothetical protein P0120_15280 [Nitrospira sp.]|nr:hypothetical protein [Nitrospira sp.]